MDLRRWFGFAEGFEAIPNKKKSAQDNVDWKQVRFTFSDLLSVLFSGTSIQVDNPS
jgi:hypothetical protein